MKRQTLCLEFQVHTCSAPVTLTMIPVGRWSVEEHYMFLTPYTQSQKLARVTKGLSWQSLFTRVLLHRLRKKNCLLRNSTDLPWRRRSAYSHSAPPTTCPRLQFSAHLEACYFRYRRWGAAFSFHQERSGGGNSFSVFFSSSWEKPIFQEAYQDVLGLSSVLREHLLVRPVCLLITLFSLASSSSLFLPLSFPFHSFLLLRLISPRSILIISFLLLLLLFIFIKFLMTEQCWRLAQVIYPSSLNYISLPLSTIIARS